MLMRTHPFYDPARGGYLSAAGATVIRRSTPAQVTVSGLRYIPALEQGHGGDRGCVSGHMAGHCDILPGLLRI